MCDRLRHRRLRKMRTARSSADGTQTHDVEEQLKVAQIR
jgi:hypothetical protein